MTLLEKLRRAMAQRAAYVATKREIEMMPLDVALDLEIFREDAAVLARLAVYGGPTPDLWQAPPAARGQVSNLRERSHA